MLHPGRVLHIPVLRIHEDLISGPVLLEVDSATSVDMTYNGIGVISDFALKEVAPFCIHPQTFAPHHV
jgi:hypothetical protein